MIKDFLKEKEKKVEYVELIYDLIFVYLIGRNNSLMAHVEDGFVRPDLYLTYILCTLITIQIWYSSTLFINRFGTNSLTEYTGLFINMFLLYYMADGTRIRWQEYYFRYNIAWALILLNLAVQYYLKYRSLSGSTPWEADNIRHHIRVLLIQDAVILAGILIYIPTRLPLTPAAMVLGMVLEWAGRKKRDLVAVDFNHLSERVMLYIVFTFGEMIIAISGYFEGGFSLNNFYFSAMAFLIVVGLFMSYGYFYDHLLDREMHVSGNTYMFLHIFIIFALSSLTTALEFMREPDVSVVAKNIFLVASFLIYFLFLFLCAPYTKCYQGILRIFRPLLVILGIFIVLMIFFYRNARISIAVSVLLCFTIWQMERQYNKKCIAK